MNTQLVRTFLLYYISVFSKGFLTKYNTTSQVGIGNKDTSRLMLSFLWERN